MNMKNIFVAALLLFGSITYLTAQDKYDLAVVGYLRDVPKPLIVVSLNGVKFEQYEVERQELEGKQWGVTLNPLIKQVNKMQNEGWEVVGGVTASGLPDISLFYYNLRKKR